MELIDCVRERLVFPFDHRQTLEKKEMKQNNEKFVKHTSRPSNFSIDTTRPVPLNNDNIGRSSSSLGGKRLL